MKVMLICPHYGPPWNEGSKNIVRVLAEGLPEHGVEVVIYSEKDASQTRHFSSEYALSVFMKKPLFWWKAAKEARIQKVEAIHLLSSASAILGLKSFIIRRFSGIPLLLHVTGLESPLYGYKWLLTADLIAVGGHYLKRFFPNSLDLPPVSPHVNPECGNQSWQLRLGQKPRKILYLGAMEPVRGVHTLIDALAALIKHFGMEDVTATIAWNGYGDRKYLRHIEEKVKEHQIQPHVVWKQTITDLPAFYQAHDLIVIPRASRDRMAFPLRLIEAMSYGKPVVVSDLGEMPRIIGQCGLVFLHEDAGSLAEALERLLSDRSLYKECAENCYQKAKEYHPSRTIRRLVDLYREIALGS